MSKKGLYEGDNTLSKKIVVVGNSGVGKTALVLRYVQDTFSAEIPTTIGGSYLAKKTIVDNVPINLQIWDTAGQERFRSMVRIYYRGAAAAVLVFDVTVRESFAKLQEWVTELQSVLGNNTTIALACNKIDLESRRQVTAEEATAYAHSIGAAVYETSAKTTTGVNELFEHVASSIIKALPPEERANGGSISIDPKPGPARPEKSSCCHS